MLKPATLPKVTLLRGYFSRFLNFKNATKLCKHHIDGTDLFRTPTSNSEAYFGPCPGWSFFAKIVNDFLGFLMISVG